MGEDKILLYCEDQIDIIENRKKKIHVIRIDDIAITLTPEIFEELAKTGSVYNFRLRLDAVEHTANSLLNEKGVSYETLQLAMAKARINELEEQLRYANFIGLGKE